MAAIAVYSAKGGVGKTTLAVNLAWCAARTSARRTLVWDLDPQGAATYLLAPRKTPKDNADAIFSGALDAGKLVRPSGSSGIDCIAADRSLRGLDRLFGDLDRKKRLAKLLGTLAGDYDRILLDCPPGLADTGEQVMRAADIIVVPVTPSPLSARAFAEMSQQLGRMKKAKAVLLPVHSLVDRRRTLHRGALTERPDWPVVPSASIAETMALRRQPIGSFAPASPLAVAVSDLWRRIEQMLSRQA